MQTFGNHILLFDGVCKLCNWSVQFVLKHDKKALIKLASIQSDVGQELLKSRGLIPAVLESVVYIKGDRCYLKSTAILHVISDFGGVWKVLFAIIIVPRFMRDAIYDFLAKHRYRLFGFYDSCMVPGAEVEDRFLSDSL